MLAEIPCGLDQIRATFGSLIDVPKNLITFPLPYPMLYGTTAVRRATCHRLAEDHFVGALKAIDEAGLSSLCLRYGGIYANRVMRGGRHPSTHAWGIAIDLESERYPLDSENRFPDAVVEIFRQWGFFYGGDFKHRADPMHFQLAEGY